MLQGKSVAKYLERYAEPTAALAALLPSPVYTSAAVMPAFDESFQDIESAVERIDGTQRLLVVVCNVPSSAKEQERRATERLRDELRESGDVAATAGELTLLRGAFSRCPALDVLLIDACSGALALGQKEGVGRARKMGLDAALALHQRGKCSAEYVGSTDADVVLPSEYFSTLEGAESGVAALLYPYRHVSSEPEVAHAMERVEMGFRYYVLGLAFARSPYAYHSLGSALAVSFEHYVLARGVPNRQAGEDFYLLSKLGKMAPLRRVSPVIEIRTRLSERVPFGTGPSLLRALGDSEHAERTYDPAVFSDLRAFLAWMQTFALGGPPEPLNDWWRQEAELWSSRLKPELDACPSAQHRLARFHEKFDALNTLQFIHRAEEIHPKISWPKALEQAEFLGPSPQQGWPNALMCLESDLPTSTGPWAHIEELRGR